MNRLEQRLSTLNPGLFAKLQAAVKQVELLLTKYDAHFPTYTDHSINHTKEVFFLASELLNDNEIQALNDDELYILSMACYLHDVGMCIPLEKLEEIASKSIIQHRANNPTQTTSDYIRDIHHLLSNDYIQKEWETLQIPSLKYAVAIGRVAQGHRKVDLSDIEIYDPHFHVKSGRSTVCLPYLAAILRVADELDVTNVRTPKLLTKLYMPNNAQSLKEWNKHLATTLIEFNQHSISYDVTCSDHQAYAALHEQFEKIQNTITYAQKIIRAIPTIDGRKFELLITEIKKKFQYENFDPKGIKFSFDVLNVIKAFIGENLYENKLMALREAIQNSIDSCLLRKALGDSKFAPHISITVDKEFIEIADNGMGMDDFIVENFFSKLCSSFYEQEKIKNQYEAIGQFGVGVFSYFLLAYFIDIDTKVEKGVPLRFRIDSDPKNYFHFFNDNLRSDTGTSIKLHIKKNLIGTYKNEEIVQYVRQTFRHIDIPIKIIGEGVNTNVLSLPFEIDAEKEINSRISYVHRKKGTDYEVISATIKNLEFEGQCCVFVSKNLPEIFESPYLHFNTERYREVKHATTIGEVLICQKGIFVAAFSGTYLQLVIGNINLLQKKQIGINRSDFSNPEEIRSIITQFEAKLIELMFDKISQVTKSEHVKYSQQFLSNRITLFRRNPNGHNPLLSALNNTVTVEVQLENKSQYLTLHELTEKCPRFILAPTRRRIPEISAADSLPVVICQDLGWTSGYHNLSEIFDQYLHYTPSTIQIGQFGYQKYEMNSELRREYESYNATLAELSGYVNFIRFGDPTKALTRIDFDQNTDSSNIQHTVDYNINPRFPLFKILLNNAEIIKQDPESQERFKAMIELLAEWNADDEPKKVTTKFVDRLNELIPSLNVIIPEHRFTEESFEELT